MEQASKFAATVEAVDRFLICAEDPKEAVDSCEFKHHSRVRRYCRQPDVAIALHGFLEAIQQRPDSCAIHLTQSGAVEHDTRPVSARAILQFAQQVPQLLRIHLFREMLY
jgi:hypothetical protein